MVSRNDPGAECGVDVWTGDAVKDMEKLQRK